MRLKTRERGVIEVLTIHETHGEWEKDWEPLRGTPIGALFSRVSKRVLDHVLNGWSNPFVEALGIEPAFALAKIPSQHCAKQYGCTLHDPRKCLVSSRKLPWCYEPAELDSLSELARSKAAEVVFLWKQEVYVVVVVQDAQ